MRFMICSFDGQGAGNEDSKSNSLIAFLFRNKNHVSLMIRTEIGAAVLGDRHNDVYAANKNPRTDLPQKTTRQFPDRDAGCTGSYATNPACLIDIVNYGGGPGTYWLGWPNGVTPFGTTTPQLTQASDWNPDFGVITRSDGQWNLKGRNFLMSGVEASVQHLPPPSPPPSPPPPSPPPTLPSPSPSPPPSPSPAAAAPTELMFNFTSTRHS